MTESTYTPAYRQNDAGCIVCQGPLEVRLAQGRKSGKSFVMLLCGVDARHFRAFVNDQDYVRRVLERMEASS